MDRVGDWIQTFTGRQFWPLSPHVDDIVIEDIAHALSNKCRYGGHTRRFYSVAEHSVLVARRASPEHRLTALLHDASEAYLADVPRPVKPFLTGYAALEQTLDEVIAERFGLTYPWPHEVHELDCRILIDERDALMAPCPVDWNLPYAPLGLKPFTWPPEYAERQFMAAFNLYTAERQFPAAGD